MGKDSGNPGSRKSQSASAPLTKSDTMPTARTFDDDERYGLRTIELNRPQPEAAYRVGPEAPAKVKVALSFVLTIWL